MAERTYRMTLAEFRELQYLLERRGYTVELDANGIRTRSPSGAAVLSGDYSSRRAAQHHQRGVRITVDERHEEVIRALESSRGGVGIRPILVGGMRPSRAAKAPRTPVHQGPLPYGFEQRETRTYRLTRPQYRRLQRLLEAEGITLEDPSRGAAAYRTTDGQPVGEVSRIDSRGRYCLRVTNEDDRELFEAVTGIAESRLRMRSSEPRPPEIRELQPGQTRVSLNGYEFAQLQHSRSFELRPGREYMDGGIRTYDVIDRDGRIVARGTYYMDRLDDHERSAFIMTYSSSDPGAAAFDRAMRRRPGIGPDRFEHRELPSTALATRELRDLLWRAGRRRGYSVEWQGRDRCRIMRGGREIAHIDIQHNQFSGDISGGTVYTTDRALNSMLASYSSPESPRRASRAS